MFRSTLYHLLLLPAFLLHTANASIRWDSIRTVQYPKYYVVHDGGEVAGDAVKLAEKTAFFEPPAGNNLVVYKNGSISDPSGHLFIGADSNYTTLIWVSEPLSWSTVTLSSGFSPYAWKNDNTIVCWHHTANATTVDLKNCPFRGTPGDIEYSWEWD